MSKLDKIAEWGNATVPGNTTSKTDNLSFEGMVAKLVTDKLKSEGIKGSLSESDVRQFYSRNVVIDKVEITVSRAELILSKLSEGWKEKHFASIEKMDSKMEKKGYKRLGKYNKSFLFKVGENYRVERPFIHTGKYLGVEKVDYLEILKVKGNTIWVMNVYKSEGVQKIVLNSEIKKWKWEYVE